MATISNDLLPEKVEFEFIINRKQVVVVMYRFKYRIYVNAYEVCWHKWDESNPADFCLTKAIILIEKHSNLI